MYWMDTELGCVTAQRIAQTFQVSRSQASKLLLDIANERTKDCRITICQQVNEGHVQGENKFLL